MTSTYIQKTILSGAPLKGYFKYKDIFQLFPHDLQNALPAQDHPLVMEMHLDDDIYPDRSEVFWHRDVWENERFEFIKRRSPTKKMNPDDEWVQAYQGRTKSLRKPAIAAELCNLLTLFSKHQFFQYENTQGWVIPADPENGFAAKSIWGQRGFISEYNQPIEMFSEVTCDELTYLSLKEYNSRIRDGIYAGEEHRILFPENITLLLDTYFSLPAAKKTAYFTACHLYNQALLFSRSNPSLSLVSAVMAIERLMNHETGDRAHCEKCGTPKSIETCGECDSPIYKSTTRFREFMTSNCHPEQDSLYNKMYAKRSDIAHGGLLRDDLFDSGFFAGDKDNEEGLSRVSLVAVRNALLYWLVT